MDTQTLGSALKALRERAALTQPQLAAACAGVRGVNQGAISRWEGGAGAPSSAQLIELHRACGGSAQDLSELLSLLVGVPVEVAT